MQSFLILPSDKCPQLEVEPFKELIYNEWQVMFNPIPYKLQEFPKWADIEKGWEPENELLGGWIFVPNPQEWGLSGGRQIYNRTVLEQWQVEGESRPELFAVSVLHQLHCLKDIRRLMLDGEKLVDDSRDPASDFHVEHCFTYLRESILCAGDMTIERMDEKHHSAPVGSGVTRKCKDFDKMYAEIQRWAYPDCLLPEHKYQGCHLGLGLCC